MAEQGKNLLGHVGTPAINRNGVAVLSFGGKLGEYRYEDGNYKEMPMRELSLELTSFASITASDIFVREGYGSKISRVEGNNLFEAFDIPKHPRVIGSLKEGHALISYQSNNHVTHVVAPSLNVSFSVNPDFAEERISQLITSATEIGDESVVTFAEKSHTSETLLDLFDLKG